jgi:hypothetical protein
MTVETEFRKPTDAEQALLNRLLDDDFPGRDELAHLFSLILVKVIDKDGGLELQSQLEGKAPVVKRVPIEAEGKDVDGVVVHMLLHVVDGRPVELEFYREDAGAVKNMPTPSDFDLIVLPVREKNWGNPA